MLQHMASNRYALDFSNEVLDNLASQEAVKISEVKLGGWKKKLITRRVSVSMSLRLSEQVDFLTSNFHL